MLHRLQALIADMPQVDDPSLPRTLDTIALRARVELARLGEADPVGTRQGNRHRAK